MKTTIYPSIAAGFLLLAMPGCAVLNSGEGKLIESVVVSPGSVQLASSLATSGALRLFQKQKDPAKLKTVAGECESVSAAVRSMASGVPPTVEQFQTTIRQFGGPTISPVYASIVVSISSIYASFYPSIQANPDAAKVTAYLEALASGVENGAAPYQ